MKKQMKLSKLLPALEPEIIDGICALVPEPEETTLFRKGLIRDIEELKEGERTAIQYISTRDIDRDHEILDPKGAILDQFRLAPQVLWGHDYSEPPIGVDEWIKVDDDGYGILAKTRYGDEGRAAQVFRLKQLGILKTQSVGFVPIENVEKDGPGWTEVIKKLARRWVVDAIEYFKDVKRIHTKWLLLEHSDVSVASNVNALQQAVSKGLKLSPELLKELGVEELLGEPMLIPEGKPYPDEHACRLADPGQFDRFRRGTRTHEGKVYSVIFGIKNNKAQDQAYRYKKDVWTAGEARSHCKAHDGSFEAAAARRLVIIPVRRTIVVPESEDRKILRILKEVVDTKRGRV